jgi:hypothetical protein
MRTLVREKRHPMGGSPPTKKKLKKILSLWLMAHMDAEPVLVSLSGRKGKLCSDGI